jgi:hypothetical protein
VNAAGAGYWDMASKRTMQSIAAPIVQPRPAQPDWLIALEKQKRPTFEELPI